MIHSQQPLSLNPNTGAGMVFAMALKIRKTVLKTAIPSLLLNQIQMVKGCLMKVIPPRNQCQTLRKI